MNKISLEDRIEVDVSQTGLEILLAPIKDTDDWIIYEPDKYKGKELTKEEIDFVIELLRGGNWDLPPLLQAYANGSASVDEVNKAIREAEQSENSAKEIKQPSVTASGGGGGEPPKRPDDDLIYLQRRNRKSFLEKELKIGIDVDSCSGVFGGSRYALSLFGEQAFVDTLRRAANGIKVKNKYLSGIVFVSPYLQTKDPRIRELLKELQDTPIAYDRNTRKIYIRDDTSVKLLSEGGLYHEWFHAKIFQQYHKKFKALEKEFDLSRNYFLHNVEQSYEDVLIHAMTFKFMKRDRNYVAHVSEKMYNISIDDTYGYLSFTTGIGKIISDRRTSKKERDKYLVLYAEVLAAYTHLDKNIAKNILITLDIDYKTATISDFHYHLIKKLAHVFTSVEQHKYISNLKNLLSSLEHV